jgi:hypothetical protein
MRDFRAKSKNNFKNSLRDAESPQATSTRTTTYELEEFFLAAAIRVYAMFHQRPQMLQVRETSEADRFGCSARCFSTRA